jgi:hypothetical protein
LKYPSSKAFEYFKDKVEEERKLESVFHQRDGSVGLSRKSTEAHLDATGDRELAFCHLCEHKWYRDESDLII